MIAYPILVDRLDLPPDLAGIFLGATIHDVAQVVGAGFSISEEVGDMSTVVKLIRVALLAPIILVASLTIRQLGHSADPEGKRPPLVPGFILAFAALVALNSFSLIPGALIQLSSDISRWALLTAIAAVGLKTSLKDVLDVGGRAIGLIVSQTVFIAALVLMAIYTVFAPA